MSKKKKIAIAGATGFIGRWFIETYKDKYDIIALSRKKVNPSNSDVEWRMVDLFSISSSNKALEGVDYALYLVHSMQPSTRLNQSNFEDTDLLLADNFSRAAQNCSLKHIVYVGGILPKDNLGISKHLLSRFEVEQVLGSRTTPVTAVRAGIIIGPGGSSFRIVTKLVKNLPIMACPEWTKSKNQPIDLRIALKSIHQIIGNKNYLSRFVDLNISNLAGVPSIVYGMLGMVIFVRWFGLGESVLAGALTMSLLILPIIIIATREALRAVSGTIRQAAFALGATRWQTVYAHVLPQAFPGILTGIISTFTYYHILFIQQ